MMRTAIVLGAALVALAAVATQGELHARANALVHAASHTPLHPAGHLARAVVAGPAAGLSTASGPVSLPRVALLPVPAGSYSPFYKDDAGSQPIAVRAFAIDARPVSQLDFHEFLADHPDWRRSQLTALFAEQGYLGDWRSDLEFAADADAPLTRVSWFAAKAYCAAHGERLPSVSEWERAAASGLLGDTKSALEQARLWEWTYDFNSVLVSGGSDDATSLFCGAGARSTRPEQYAEFLRYAFRSSLKANYALKNLGFRCAKDAA
jgi:formylglycine-generating enzyme required for sulfatase activity